MSDKKVIYAVAGGAAFVGAAVLFYLYSSNKGEVTVDLCMEEIEALGPKQMTPQGILAFEYYKNIFAIISKHAKLKFGAEKRNYIDKRRVLL
jgi:hypothetical protein